MNHAQPKMIRACSIWRALNLLGDKPTLLILESYWLGSRRFAQFCEQTGLLKTVVSARLQKLVDEGVMVKSLYSSAPKRYEYRGTDKLHTLYSIALCMLNWETKWSTQKNKVQVKLTHLSCGETTNPVAVCKHCRDEINPREIDWQEGPGLSDMPALYDRRRKSRSGAQTKSKTALFDNLASIIGDRWSMLVIRALFTGKDSFNEIQQDSQIATNILSERLQDLVDQKIIVKINAKKNQAQHYKLTERGIDIYPIIVGLMSWGDRWCADEKGPPMILKHQTCGHDLVFDIACPHCLQSVDVSNLKFEVLN